MVHKVACKNLLVSIFFLCCTVSSFAKDAIDPDAQPSVVPGYSLGFIKALYNQLERTGLGFDSIPPIGAPQYVSVSDAGLSMDDDEVVFIVTFPQGTTRIYPQRLLVWHEVINDVLPLPTYTPDETYRPADTFDRQYTITYSPLSGAVVAFRSLAGRFPTSFGSTGELVNANTVLYDRVSHTMWCQLLGVGFDGPLTGHRLERIQVLWATWKGVKARYTGKAEVLSRSTGIRRPYGKDPYGSYSIKGTYYDNIMVSNKLSFLDKRLHPKTQILGIEYDSLHAALQKHLVKRDKIFNFSMGITPMVAIYDEELDAVRVFDRRVGGEKDEKPLDFIVFEGKFTDKQSNSVWTAEGVGTYGKYREIQLEPIYTIDCMWMTWAAFHRNSPIYP